MLTRQDIVDEARTWMKTKWVHQACVKGLGVDCLGLIGGVALALGIEGAEAWKNDPRYHCYGPTPDPFVLIEGCDKFLDRIPLSEVKIGDILVMAFEREPQHFGIVSALNPTYLIHSYAQARRVVENNAAMAKVKILRAYRYRGID